MLHKHINLHKGFMIEAIFVSAGSLLDRAVPKQILAEGATWVNENYTIHWLGGKAVVLHIVFLLFYDYR